MPISKDAVFVDAISQRYPGKQDFLKKISIRIERGQTVCLIGKNGAGKTTLLKCISGILPIQEGSIALFTGNHKSELRSGSAPVVDIEIRKKVGVVFQEPTLWPHLTVLQNVTAPLIDVHLSYKDKMSAIKEAEERAAHWLSILANKKDIDWKDYPHKLSGGYAQRVAIARAFAIEPEILLLDEITANLDPDGVERVLYLLEKYFVQDKSKTILMSTHRMDILLRWEPRVAAMDNGTLVEWSGSKIFEQPSAGAKLLPAALGPWNTEWILTDQCFGIARSFLKEVLEHREIPAKMFQTVAEEISSLISQLEPKDSHLVLIVTVSGIKEKKEHRIVAAYQSKGFYLDGRDAPTLPRREGEPIVDPTRLGTEGVVFNSWTDQRGSLIAKVLAGAKPLAYRYSPTHEPISGVKNWCLDVMEDEEEKTQYYEFSKNTKNVYLFQMESQGEIIGVLSVDTTAETKWLPFVVRQLKVIAELGAIAIRIVHIRARATTA